MGRRFAFPAGISCPTRAPLGAFRFDRGTPTPESFRFLANPDKAASIAAATEGAKRKFEGVAYSGDKISGHWYWGDVVFDLASTAAPNKLPMLLGHDRDKVVGFSNSVDVANEIKVAGLLSGVTEEGKQVAALSDEGFPWQMSVHIEPKRVEEVGAGEMVTVNGRQFTGPINVFRNNVIREISFTPTGWDAQTSAVAMAHGVSKGADEMDPKELEKLQARAAERDTFEATAKAEKEAREKAEREAAESKAKVAEFEAAQVAQAKAKRDADVKALFEKCGIEMKDETAKPYREMDEATFAAVSKQLSDAAEKAAPGAHLFGEQATRGTGAASDPAAIANRARQLQHEARQRGEHLHVVDAVKLAQRAA